MATATELRSQVAELSDQATAELAAVWAQIRAGAEAPSVLMEVIPSLVLDYSDAAAVFTAQWYDEYRAELNVPRAFTADLPTLDLGGEALAGWGESLITPDDVNWDAALQQVSGGLEKRVAVAARETISQNVHEDPVGVGWQRQARPTGCGFCQMLAGRGAVYKSRDTGNFGAHDNCQCVALPAFGGLPVPVRPYTPTSATITDADRARTRAWIKKNL